MKKSIQGNGKKLLSLSFLVVVLSGCSTGPGTIYHKFNLDEGESLSIGARQRVVTNTDILPTSRPGLVNPRQIVCSEPSPDVAIAVANSFGSSLSIFGQGSGAVSGSQAEGLAQLAERTVTVQLLRDQMYRACESYANGAISGTTYSLLMSKNNDAMITLMLGETAGGAFGRSLAAIGGAASSEAEAKLQGFAAVTGDFKQGVKDLAAANEKVEAAKGKLADKKDIEAKQDTPTAATDAVKENNKEEVEKAEKELTAAEFERDTIAESLQSKSEAVAKSAAEVRNLTAAGNIESKASPEIAKVLAGMQSKFLDEDFADEYVSACIVELGLSQKLSGKDELTFDDAVNAYQKAQIEERDHLFMSLFPRSSVTRVTNDRLSTMSTIATRNRRSNLAVHCENNLDHIMYVSLDQKFALDRQVLEEQRNLNRMGIISEYNKALSNCAKIANALQQTQCRNAAAKFLDPDAIPVPIPTAFVVPSETVLPLTSYIEAEKELELLQTKQSELKATKIPVFRPGPDKKDPLKAEKDALEKSALKFTDDVTKMLSDASKQISTTKKTDVETLNSKFNTLEAYRQLSLKDENKPNAEKFAALIKVQQIEAQQSKAQYKALAEKMFGLSSRISLHIAAVNALIAKEKKLIAEEKKKAEDAKKAKEAKKAG